MQNLSQFSRTLLRQLILTRQSELDRRATTATCTAELAIIKADRDELISLWEEIAAETEASNDDGGDTGTGSSRKMFEAGPKPARRKPGRPPKQRDIEDRDA